MQDKLEKFQVVKNIECNLFGVILGFEDYSGDQLREVDQAPVDHDQFRVIVSAGYSEQLTRVEYWSLRHIKLIE